MYLFVHGWNISCMPKTVLSGVHHPWKSARFCNSFRSRGNGRQTSWNLQTHFSSLEKNFRHLTHHHWCPCIIVCDFEIALWGAVQMEFPAAALSGCYFHWTQSLWRKVQDLGLAGQYRQNRQLRKLVRKAMALGFLPLALVRISFQQLLHSQNTQRLIQTYPELQEFLVTYLQNRYILANAQFPPADWNVFNRDMDQRTNNSVECKYALISTKSLSTPST